MLIDDIFSSGVMDGHLDPNDLDNYSLDCAYLVKLRRTNGAIFNVYQVYEYFENMFFNVPNVWASMKSKVDIIYPPTDLSWFEWKMASARVGVLACVCGYDDEVFGSVEVRDSYLADKVPEKMIYLAFFFTTDNEGTPPIPMSSFLFIDDDGHVIEGRNGRPGIARAMNDEYLEIFQDMVYMFTLITLFTLSFINVKNIVKVEHKPDRKLQERRKKRGQLPLVKYYTLEVEVPGKRVVGPTDGGPSETASRPLHLVRGHLADYRDGKGLFGKYKGVYWVPAHMRGDIDNGVIKKRYKVTTERESR